MQPTSANIFSLELYCTTITFLVNEVCNKLINLHCGDLCLVRAFGTVVCNVRALLAILLIKSNITQCNLIL